MTDQAQPAQMRSGCSRDSLNYLFERWRRSFSFNWRCIGAKSVALFGFLPRITSFAAAVQTPQPVADSTQAQVTFFSPHVTALGGLTRGRPGAFKGRLFFDDDQLAFMEPGHFVTFLLPPGPHILSATTWMVKHANSGAHVTLDLAPGRHYFVQTSIHTVGILAFAFDIESVDCSAAVKANLDNKPLESSHLRPFGKPLARTGTDFPSCP